MKTVERQLEVFASSPPRDERTSQEMAPHREEDQFLQNLEKESGSKFPPESPKKKEKRRQSGNQPKLPN